jgi:molybdopterin-biosynthesis enzyme MoeA-like protein
MEALVPGFLTGTSITPTVLEARKRMALLPYGDLVRVVYPCPELWVPVVVVDNVHVLPGVPRLFEALVSNLIPTLDNANVAPLTSVELVTPKRETAIAHILSSMQQQVDPYGITIGSYPKWVDKDAVVHVVVSGRDAERVQECAQQLFQLMDKA